MTGANILQDGLRSVLWLFCQFALWLMDLCYSVINDLATLDLGDFQFIWSWFRGVSALLFFFLTIRMFIYYVKATLEEDKLQKIDPLDFLQRIAYVSAILLMLPTMLGMFSSLTANLVDSVGTLAGVDETETVPSHIVAAAGYNGDIDSIVMGSHVFRITALQIDNSRFILVITDVEHGLAQFLKAFAFVHQ